MSSSTPAGRWREAFVAYARHPRVRAMLLLGFASGLPFPLVLTTLSARLRLAGIDRATIGYFSLVGLAYSLKFFWSPLVDRLSLPLLHRLGRRRSWMLLAQAGVVAGLIGMAVHDPAASAETIAWLAVVTAFASATQDIAIDAWRIEAAANEWQGEMAAAYQVGYQLALIASGAGALLTASSAGWSAAYLTLTACFAVGPLTVLLIPEPELSMDRATLAQEARVVAFVERSAHWPGALRDAAAWLIGAVVCPFVDFFNRQGLRIGLPILALVVTYRLNYMTMGVAANTFYLDLGYTLDQIALVSKVYGVLMTLAGALAAGALVKRYGTAKTLLAGALLLTAANLFYAVVATRAGHPPALAWLAAAISLDNVGNGIAGTAFIAYLSALTSTAYTATQYALFGTLWSLPAKSLASQWGRIVDAFGYPPFFVYTAAIGVPSLLLVLWLIRRQNREHAAHGP
ncbi:MAG: MFS transporter [Gammaproteobacteria bacterium]|nr:MFS transporter [Gammaproteobacteria bacterium]